MEELVEQVKVVYELMFDLTTVLEQQSIGIKKIKEAMEEMNQVTLPNTANSE